MKQLSLFFLSLIFLASCQKGSDEPDSGPLAAQTQMNVAYGSDPQQKMDLYLPAGRTDTTRLIVLVHGGAWVEGDKADFTTYVATLQQRLPGYAIANINYRLATASSNKFPTQENDMKAAVDYLAQKSGDLHISQKFVLLGASAGGHLSLLQAYKYTNPRIKAVISFFGPTDMTALHNAYAGNTLNQIGIQILMNGTPTTNTALYMSSSPINFVTAQSTPTLLLHGDADVVVPVAQSQALATKLATFNVPHQIQVYPGMGHDVWPATQMNDAFTRIENFIRQYSN